MNDYKKFPPVAGAWRPLGSLLLGLLLIPAAAQAQSSNQSTPAAPAPADVGASASSSSSDESSQVVKLNPFEVESNPDNSYGALNSNSITRFNTALDKMPISANIFTSTFMQDVGATSVEAMIETYSAGAGYSGADPGGSAATEQPGDRNGNSYITLRGFQTPTMLRDAFMPVGSQGNPGSTGVGYTSLFDVETVEIIMGPQALLYGQGGAGGVINIVSKQAKLGAPAAGSISYQIDQYGSKQGLLDYGAGNNNVALRVAILDQDVGNRRENVGGPLQGEYAQLAFKLFDNTTVRVTGEQTYFNRINSNDSSFTALSTTNDSRNGDKLNYLIATNQLNTAAGGAPSGAGPIDNGQLNWSNVNSLEGQWASELTIDRFTDLTADSVWNSWFSTQFDVGYNSYYDDRVNESFTFYAPNSTAGMPGVWSGKLTPGDTTEPVQTKGIRFVALATNDLFGGRAHSQSEVGVDDIVSVQGEFAYEYFQADGNFNPVYGAANTLNGRTAMPAQTWDLTNGPQLYNIFTPRNPYVTVGGVNYVRMLQNPVSPAAVSPADPLGVTLGGANYSLNHTTNEGVFGTNYTQWLGGKLDTLLGFRAARNLSYDENQGSAPPSAPAAYRAANENAVSFDVGADYNITSWLHPYFSVSDSDDPPVSNSANPYGVLPLSAHGIGEEVGLKINNAANSLSGTLAFYHTKSTNEQLTLSSTIENDVNPSGLNGRWNSPNQWINIDRQSQGVQLNLTAAPTSNWRMILGAGEVAGTVGSTVSFGQLYNDQFNENSAGQVTYADGTVVYVNPTYNSKTPTVTSSTAGAIPLTVAAMNTPGNAYYADPVTVNGQISSSAAVYTVLKTTDPVHGSIATGVAGLPISQAQINVASNSTVNGYIAPPGNIVAAQNGDSTTGYPKFSFSFTNVYTFSSGWIKGFELGGSIQAFWQYRDYYYYANGVTPTGAGRTLFYLPNQGILGLIAGYSRKFDRVTWMTKLNVYNLLNHYDVVLLPGENTGYTVTGTDATFNTQPRSFQWTNTIKF